MIPLGRYSRIAGFGKHRRHGGRSSGLSRGCGALTATVCGVSSGPCSAVAPAARVVEGGSGAGAARRDRRYFFRALESGESHVGPALRLIARLYAVEERAQALSLSAEQRLSLRPTGVGGGKTAAVLRTLTLPASGAALSRSPGSTMVLSRGGRQFEIVGLRPATTVSSSVVIAFLGQVVTDPLTERSRESGPPSQRTV